jgi:hypothetical protein
MQRRAAEGKLLWIIACHMLSSNTSQ